MPRSAKYQDALTLIGAVLLISGAARADDCNSNGVPDDADIYAGTSRDCQPNDVPDECDIAAGTSHDYNANTVPDECDPDCNGNGTPDFIDILMEHSEDCNTNGVPDECEPAEDCNTNGVQDICDLAAGTSGDCNTNAIPDECEMDCNTNGFPDDCDLAAGTSPDCNTNAIPDECETECNGNGIPDDCDLAAGTSDDCNSNGAPDECDLAAGTSPDFNTNGVPDECEEDCNTNGWPDFWEIAIGIAEDCNDNLIPDDCESQNDCQPNGILDICDLVGGTSDDCNGNAIPDECDVAAGSSDDLNSNGVPDECEFDCNSNGLPDLLDIALGTSGDCNSNAIPDECDIAACAPDDLSCADCNANGVPDECEPDCNTNGIADECDLAAIMAYNASHGTLPDEQGFTLVHSNTNPSPDYKIENGALHQGPTSLPGYQHYVSSDLLLDFTVGFQFTAVLEVVSSDYANCYGRPLAGYGIGATDDEQRVFWIWIAEDRIIVHNSTTDTSTGSSFDTTGLYHDYRFVVEESVGSLFVDEELFVSVEVGPVGQECEANTVWFGDGTSCAQSETYLRTLAYHSPADPSGGNSTDCDLNGIPDECESPDDCNTNGIQDFCDIAAGTSQDCNTNAIPDDCELADNDCNTNSVPDQCELVENDCNTNAIPDDCELVDNDCNANNIPDDCDLVAGTSNDCDGNTTPDECQPDCNTNGIADACDITGGTSADCTSNGTPDECEPDCNTNGLADSCDIGAGTSEDCTGNGVPDECETDCNSNGAADSCDIYAGTSADCNSNGVPDECDIDGGTSVDCNTNGTPDSCDIGSGTSLDLNGDGIPDECERVIFVNLDAPGADDGTSWTNAFRDLRDALGEAATNGLPTQVWVAANVYTPAGPDGNREAAFELADGVKVYGGFAGDEAAFDQRNPALNVTTLSGDLNADDETTGDNGENSHHVVTAIDTDATAALDGFTITSGNADGTDPYDRGAGLLIDEGHAMAKNCIFVQHAAQYGTVYLRESNSDLTDCRFGENSAYLGGGLYSDSGAQPTLTNCSFHQNTAHKGGAVFTGASSTPALVNCLFVGNSAEIFGGGLYVGNSSPTLTNCAFSANVAEGNGGGVYVTFGTSYVAIRNSIFWGNVDAGGQDESAQIHVAVGTVEVDYCCVQGGWTGDGGTGNTAADPLFVSPPDDGGDGWGTGDNDDLGNLRLQPGSPCTDAGDNEADTSHNTQGLQALPDTDLDQASRFLDDPQTVDTGNGDSPVVDFGPYEFWGDCNTNGVADDLDITAGTSLDCNANVIPDECDIASGSSTDANSNGVPDECENCPYIYDLSGDCFADSTDLGLFAACWLLSEGDVGWDGNACADKDFDCSGVVDATDLGLFAGAWLKAHDEIDPANYPECRTCQGDIVCP